MPTFKNVAASALMLFAASASFGTLNAAEADEHSAHHPDAGRPVQAAPMPAMQDRMKAMREMHQKMMNAKTPAERQALMGDHMKAMQDGMQMMKSMMTMGEGKGMPAEMAKQRQQMMEGCMEMMQMMMDVMHGPSKALATQ